MTLAIPVANPRNRTKRRINPVTDKSYSLHEFGRLLDPPVTYETVLAWKNEGLKSGRGVVVRLETFRGTRGLRTTMSAYFRFIAALNDDA